MSSLNVDLSGVQRISSIEMEPYVLDPAVLEDKIRERTCSVTHRGISESIPEANHAFRRPLSAHSSTPPNVFIYNQEKYEESMCTSIDEIRTVPSNECLWVDITGVSPSDYPILAT